MVIFCILVRKLIMWYKYSRNFFILCYVLAIISLVTTEIFTLSKVTIESLNDPLLISPIRNPWAAYSSSDHFFSNLLSISVFGNFIVLWIATLTFTRTYSSIIGRFKFIILVSLPLVYFLGPLESNYLHLFDSFRSGNPPLANTINIIVFGGIRQIGGIFFGISFLVLMRAIKDNELKYYLMVTSMGIIIFFSCNQSSLLKIIPYPPFGIAMSLLIPISTFMIFFGFYNMTLSTKHKILKDIVNSYLSQNQKKLLRDIGKYETSTILMHVHSEVNKMPVEVKDELKELDKDELRQLILQILEEKKKSKKS